MTILPNFFLQREQTIMFELIGQTISGGQSASGQMPVTRLDGGGVWKAELSGVQLRSADHVRTWRALTSICDGGAQPVVVIMCDKRHFPAPIVNGVRITGGSVPYSDGSTHSDGTEYQNSVVIADALIPAPLRGTTINIHLSQGGNLEGGEFFSIEHPTMHHHIYRISTAISIGSGNWTIKFRPPLREAVAVDELFEFDFPKCVMRLAEANAMDMALEARKFANPNVTFIEAFPPFPE